MMFFSFIRLITLLFAISLVTTACKGFKTSNAFKSSSGLDLDGGDWDPNNNDPGGEGGNGGATTTQAFNVSFEQFQTCWERAGSGGVLMCFNANDIPWGTLTQSKVNQCAALQQGNIHYTAICLHKNGYPLKGYREPMQSDLEACDAKVPLNKLAVCLDKNGLLVEGLEQDDINACIVAKSLTEGNIDGLEWCLRKNNHLHNFKSLPQHVVNVCAKIHGPSNVLDCLQNKGFITTTEEVTTFNGCVSAKGIWEVVWCLRKNHFFGANVLTAYEINQCLGFAGRGGLAACLELNNLLPEGLTQAVLEDRNTGCYRAVDQNNNGITHPIQCMRKKGFLTKVLTQAHINICNKLVGEEKIGNCIALNGLLPWGYEDGPAFQAKLDTCIAVDGIDVSNVTKCLRKTRVLPRVIGLGDVKFCEGAVGREKVHACLTAGNFWGVANFDQARINTCFQKTDDGDIPNPMHCLRLPSNPAIETTLLQDHIYSCDLHAGWDNVAGCLSANRLVEWGFSQADLNGCKDAMPGGNPLPYDKYRFCLGKTEKISYLYDAEAADSCSVVYGDTEAGLWECQVTNGLFTAMEQQWCENAGNTTHTDVHACMVTQRTNAMNAM